MIKLSGQSSFQLSTTEQVYPLATWDDGSTLYCKKIDLGYLNNGGQEVVAHGILNIDLARIFEFKIIGYNGVDTTVCLTYSAQFYSFLQPENIVFGSEGGQANINAYAHVIYGKTV